MTIPDIDLSTIGSFIETGDIEEANAYLADGYILMDVSFGPDRYVFATGPDLSEPADAPAEAPDAPAEAPVDPDAATYTNPNVVSLAPTQAASPSPTGSSSATPSA